MGTLIDTRAMNFSEPKRKILVVKQNIRDLLKRPSCAAKQLSKIAGYLSSMYLSLGPFVRIFTRSMYRAIESRASWYKI